MNDTEGWLARNLWPKQLYVKTLCWIIAPQKGCIGLPLDFAESLDGDDKWPTHLDEGNGEAKALGVEM